ncbi:DUF262 domain-containing protein [Bosea sp. RAC05]|uniref:DUF262 domain-containing protein n=1 Tax=Bosea sp. RAC05 TaxID=1842539 RepID=UPI00083D178A|nr:DUF262 domain-containing protein [Bosea sp. RAC05]AOG02897.1 hypothetical protein BSY19_4895 [Bosea sp. RAC05]
MTDLREMTARDFSGKNEVLPIRQGLALDFRARQPNEAIGERGLGAYILPPFQRPPVWQQEQAVRFIESIWLGLPIGVYVYNESPTLGATDGWLIEGQQRWTSITSYVAGEFEVFGHLYTDLDAADQRHFMLRPFSCIVTKYDDPEKLKDIYHRLAYGGTAHEPEHAPAFR